MNSEHNPFLGVAMSNVTDALAFLLAKVIKSGDPHECYDKEFIRALAAAPDSEIGDARRKLKDRYAKDFMVRQWDADIRAARAEFVAAMPVDENAINISGMPLHVMSKHAGAALVAVNQKQPRMFDMAAGAVIITRNSGNAQLNPISIDRMRGEIDRAAKWIRFSQTGAKTASAPLEVARDILSRPEELGLPTLAAIVRRPYLNEQGELIQASGYNADTQMYLDKSAALGEIKDIRDDEIAASRCAEWLKAEIFGDFPFDGESSRTNALALLLTACLRNLIPGGVPAAAVSATAHGSGKSLIAKIVSAVDTGDPDPPNSGIGKNEEETAKQLTSIFMRNPAGLVIFDNISGYLDSSCLARAMTGTWDDRMLNTNTQVSIPVRSTQIWTGNNISVSTELSRRCYLIRLTPATSRPQDRGGWKHDPIEKWCITNRARILSCVFTIAKSWMAAGRPMMKENRLGSFDSFAGIIGGMLEHAGISGFLSDQAAQLGSTDTETSEWIGFLGVIKQWRGLGEWTASELAREMRFASKTGEALLNAAPAVIIGLMEKKYPEGSIGKVLAFRRQRRFGDENLYLDTAGTKTSPVRWVLRQDEA